MHVWVHSIEKVSTSVSPRMGPALLDTCNHQETLILDKHKDVIEMTICTDIWQVEKPNWVQLCGRRIFFPNISMHIWLAPYSRWTEYEETKTGLNIIRPILIDIPAFYEARKNIIFQRLIGYRLNYSLTSPLYDLPIIQCIEIDHWCICNMSWSYFCNWNAPCSVAFDISASLYFCFVLFHFLFRSSLELNWPLELLHLEFQGLSYYSSPDGENLD